MFPHLLPTPSPSYPPEDGEAAPGGAGEGEGGSSAGSDGSGDTGSPGATGAAAETGAGEKMSGQPPHTSAVICANTDASSRAGDRVW